MKKIKSYIRPNRNVKNYDPPNPGGIGIKRVGDRVLHFLENELFVGSKKAENFLRNVSIYLHRLLYLSGAASVEDILNIDMEALRNYLDGKEILVKAQYTNVKGAVKRGSYRISIDVDGNKICFGRSLYLQNLNYTYLNEPHNYMMRDWFDQQSGSDYQYGGEPGVEKSFFYRFEPNYSDWTRRGPGYQMDYDFYFSDDHLWETEDF